MSLDLSALPPESLREVLPSFLAGFIDGPASAPTRESVGALVATWSDATCSEVLASLGAQQAGQGVLLAHPACRELARVWSRDVVLQPTLTGVEHLAAAVAAGPTVVLGNHLSYFDTSATDSILAWAGHANLADRLVAAAGPKVYEDPFRRIAAACLHTLPVPQSTRLSHTEKISVRELARQARASLDGAVAAARKGQVLLLYPEGSRSRTGRLGSFLKGVHRYLALADEVSVVPCAIVGTDAVMPIEGTQIHPGPVSLAFGPAVHVGPDVATRGALEAAFHGVSALLPEALQPVDGTAPLA